MRFHNIFGPLGTYDGGREKSPAAICRKIALAEDGGEIEVWGDGKQTRTFAYVGDVIDAAINLMNCPAAPGRVYNIGSQEEISIELLADKIIEKTGSTAGKEYISYEEAYGKPFDDMMRRAPSLERIRETIGYEPKTTLDQILTSVIEHFQSNFA